MFHLQQNETLIIFVVALTPPCITLFSISASRILSDINSGVGKLGFLNLCEVLFAFKVIHTYFIRICIKTITTIVNWPERKTICF